MDPIFYTKISTNWLETLTSIFLCENNKLIRQTSIYTIYTSDSFLWFDKRNLYKRQFSLIWLLLKLAEKCANLFKKLFWKPSEVIGLSEVFNRSISTEYHACVKQQYHQTLT